MKYTIAVFFRFTLRIFFNSYFINITSSMNVINQIKNSSKQANGVYYLSEPRRDFEELYIKLRAAEGRLYSDSEVKMLPDISPARRHYKEWRVRKKSSAMLINYIRQNGRDKSILDLGAGSGWLSNKLAEINNCEVIGMDVNITKLEQGARVFADKQNLIFACGDIFTLEMKFDYIILAAVIAYFDNLKQLISSLLNNLSGGGEIHIIDSPFYVNTEAAEKRSEEYFNRTGFPQMAEHYHHHSLDSIKEFNHTVLYNPCSVLNKFKRLFKPAHQPFYWIKVKKESLKRRIKA
jgi:SAM-dependent methyltransferase